MASFASRFNNRFCRGGDQSLFIKKKFFESLKGFNEEYLVCEDGELIDRIYKETLFCVLSKEVKTSARRFESNGVLRLQFHFLIIHLLRNIWEQPRQTRLLFQEQIPRVSIMLGYLPLVRWSKVQRLSRKEGSREK